MNKVLIRTRIRKIVNFFLNKGIGEDSLVSFFKSSIFTAIRDTYRLKKGNVRVFIRNLKNIKLALIFKVVKRVKDLTSELSLQKAGLLNSYIKVGDSVLLAVKSKKYPSLLDTVESSLVFFLKKKALNDNLKRVGLNSKPLPLKGKGFLTQGVLKRGDRFKVLLNNSFFWVNLCRLKNLFKDSVIVKLSLQENRKKSYFIIILLKRYGGNLNRDLSFLNKNGTKALVFLWNNNIISMLKSLMFKGMVPYKIFLDVKKNVFFIKVGGVVGGFLEKSINTVLNSKVKFSIN